MGRICSPTTPLTCPLSSPLSSSWRAGRWSTSPSCFPSSTPVLDLCGSSPTHHEATCQLSLPLSLSSSRNSHALGLHPLECLSSPALSSFPAFFSPSLHSAYRHAACSRHLRLLPPMVQHQYHHWLQIRSLYESQASQYSAAGRYLPTDIETHTATSSHPITFDSYLVKLTTTTTTVMPHATATTTTSTSYQQLTSKSLRLPPSAPLLAFSEFIPPAPFSYESEYPSHPFSYPPAAVLEALLQDNETSWPTQNEGDSETNNVDVKKPGEQQHVWFGVVEGEGLNATDNGGEQDTDDEWSMSRLYDADVC